MKKIYHIHQALRTILSSELLRVGLTRSERTQLAMKIANCIENRIYYMLIGENIWGEFSDDFQEIYISKDLRVPVKVFLHLIQM